MTAKKERKPPRWPYDGFVEKAGVEGAARAQVTKAIGPRGGS